MRERHKSSLIGEIFSLPSDLHVHSLRSEESEISLWWKIEIKLKFHAHGRERAFAARARHTSHLEQLKLRLEKNHCMKFDHLSSWNMHERASIKIYEDLDTRD